VELFTMKRHAHETADHLNARISKELNEVDFAVITDIQDYFRMMATIIANDPALRKRMYLDKVNIYAKAHTAVKADEQATVHSKMMTTATAVSSEMNLSPRIRESKRSLVRQPKHTVVGTAAVTQSVAQVMVEGAPKATKPEEEGVTLRPTITQTKVCTAPTETPEGLTTRSKRPKEACLQYQAPPNAFDAAWPLTPLTTP
jgi:hypothetical protein